MKFCTAVVIVGIITVGVLLSHQWWFWAGARISGTGNSPQGNTRRVLVMAIVAKVHVPVAHMRGRSAAIPALPGEVAPVFRGILANALGLGSTRRAQLGFERRGLAKAVGTGNGPAKVGILTMAAEVKGVLAHGLLVAGLVARLGGGFGQQIVFVNQLVNLGAEFVRGSQQIFGKIGVIVFPKDAPALATLATVEQQALVVVAGGHAAHLDLLHNAIQVPLVAAAQRNNLPFRVLQRIITNGTLGRIVQKGKLVLRQWQGSRRFGRHAAC
mmetsp:Transcript_3930/g.7490  ORF Transcript_3930/g.7490 Transcript_3930/m.7490 type:complete len:270 (+) Transcript_3930:2217-3026(+)